MAIPARIRLAGTIAATALCAAAATEAAAQTPPGPPPSQEGEIVLNQQLQLGDVFAGQTLNVVDAEDQVTAGTAARGNRLTGAVEGGSPDVQSDQDMRGDTVARTDLTLNGDTAGPVSVQTEARGNELGISAYDGDMTVRATQSNTGDLVSATSEVGPTNARLLGGGVAAASAVSNATTLYGEGAFIEGQVDQSNAATVRSFSRIQSQYIPAQAAVDSQAAANSVASNANSTSGQNLAIRQSSTGAFIEAEASANAANGWDLAGRARAAGNLAQIYNEGGSVVVASEQSNTAFVRSSALTTAYDFGRAEASAKGAGNDLTVGNNDIYVEIDNAQFNSGGVDVSATFVGTQGFDAYVGADAVGNNVTGFACANCEAYLEARNDQVNEGDVSATANTTVYGQGRAVVSGSQAVGNNASFYVTGPRN